MDLSQFGSSDTHPGYFPLLNGSVSNAKLPWENWGEELGMWSAAERAPCSMQQLGTRETPFHGADKGWEQEPREEQSVIAQRKKAGHIGWF